MSTCARNCRPCRGGARADTYEEVFGGKLATEYPGVDEVLNAFDEKVRGVDLNFDPMGFVSDKDAESNDYGVDSVAAVGVAGLIAGRALNSRAGLMAGLVLFLKEAWIVLLPFVDLKSLFRRG